MPPTAEIQRPVDVDGVHRRLCTRKLRYFVEAAWPIVEPVTPFVGNWHIDTMCDELEKIERGEITRAIFNIPPGCMKSLSIMVMFPAWVWARTASSRFLTAAFIDDNTIRDNMRARDIMTSDWYRKNWPHVQFRGDQNAKTRIGTTETGWRIATSVGGGGLGEHPDYSIIDDPLNPKDANITDAKRKAANDWFDSTIAMRGASRGVRQIIVMQRLHELDLSGYLLKRGGWTHVCFPMRYDPKIASHHDRRRVKGELLWPALFDEAKVRDSESVLGIYKSAGQLQQHPVPIEGAILKREWFQFYRALPGGVTDWLQSWDCSFKETKDADFVCGGVWCRHGANRYLVYVLKERLTLPGTVNAVRTVSAAYPLTIAKLVEDKANGPAVIQSLRDEIEGLIAITPEGSKESRVHAVSPTIQAGNVFLPDPATHTNARWVEEFLDEVTHFPRAANDDQVDMMTQALLRYRSSYSSNIGAKEILGDASANEDGMPDQF